MRDLMFQCGRNLPSIVLNVHHVEATITSELPAADIDRRHSQKGRLLEFLRWNCR